MKKVISIAVVLLVAFAFVSSAEAQTKRKKKPVAKRTSSVKPVSMPTTEPLIISRAEDYPLDGQVIPQVVTEAVKQADLVDPTEKQFTDLSNRIKALEGDKKEDYDQKQKRLSLNLDILTKAELRAETLRKQSFELMEKENTVRTRLDHIETDLRPESIDRQVAFAGSLRPEDLRTARKRSLEAERTNQQNMLAEIQRTRTAVDANVLKADQLVDRLRVKLEAEIDAALTDTPIKP